MDLEETTICKEKTQSKLISSYCILFHAIYIYIYQLCHVTVFLILLVTSTLFEIVMEHQQESFRVALARADLHQSVC